MSGFAAARRLALMAAAAGLLAGCGTPPAPVADTASALRVIVAVHEVPEPRPAPGSTPRMRYVGAPQYGGSARAAGLADAVARTHGLVEEAGWSILPLELLCKQYRLPAGVGLDAALARLRADPRVALAQPLNEFESAGGPAAVATTSTSAAAAPATGLLPGYDDPYAGLQRGFAAIGAPATHRLSQGDGVRVAVIDTGIDGGHPDLAGRVAVERNFVAAGTAPPAGPRGERHGTEVAGVIAAVAHNRIGIAGIAPRAQLLAYRACWPVAGGRARCNSFTLAQALAAAIAADADVVNLSLAGPADPLLQRLVEHALSRGTVVVGALPPGGRQDGFPAGVRGVLAVASADEAAAADGMAGLPAVLRAPGRDILTLQPEGLYGYASGSSLAAAHVSGAVALLRALRPGLRGGDAMSWWQAGPVDVCRAAQQMRPELRCG